jgi:hypothetical protein
MRLFIESADLTYIKNLFGQLAKHNVPFGLISGINITPEAMQRANITTLDGYVVRLKELVELMDSITDPDNDPYVKEILVQIPNSRMSVNEIVTFSNFCIDQIETDTVVIGISLPPFPNVMMDIEQIFDLVADGNGAMFNITGIADAGTALFALSHVETEYVTLLVGMMGALGVDYPSHCVYTKLSSTESYQKRIASGLQSIAQVFEVATFGMSPSIDERLWDQFISHPSAFARFSAPLPTNGDSVVRYARGDFDFCPPSTEQSAKLSSTYFRRSDAFAKNIYKEFFIS